MVQYIQIEDNMGNKNLWKIIGEDNKNYIIRSRRTTKYIPKNFTETQINSNILIGKRKFDIKPSEIDISIDNEKNEIKGINLCFKCYYKNNCDICSISNISIYDCFNKDCWLFTDSIDMRCQENYQTDNGYLEKELDYLFEDNLHIIED